MTQEIKTVNPQGGALDHYRPATVPDGFEPPTDTGRPMRLGLLIIGVGFGGFLLWAGLAPLDEGVPTQGIVSIDTKRKPVQHLTGGLVTEILVREGQMVNAGQVLARIDPASSRANLEAEQQNYRGTQAMIDSYREQYKSLEGKRDLLRQMLAGIRDLVAEGYVARNQQLDLERQIADAQVAMIDLQGNMQRMKLQQLGSQQKIKALSDDLSRTALLSPASGQVVGLAVQSRGAVIRPADKLMDIVPLDEKLVLEARIPSSMIDRVSPGQQADVRFNAFANSPALVVDGQVDSVSQDLVTESTPNGSVSYYLARVSVTPQGLQTLGNRQMQAGMSAEVIVKTGERSLLTYLLHPLIRRVSSAMKEE